jgi:hypothetical protein
MFIEPCLVGSHQERQVRYPDLVVCNTREVIGIIELKYSPRARPSWRKDLATFEWINTNRKSIHVSNARFRGVSSDSRKYSLAASILYVWAGVHVPYELELREHIGPSLGSCFLALHAETSYSEEPRLRSSWAKL